MQFKPTKIQFMNCKEPGRLTTNYSMTAAVTQRDDLAQLLRANAAAKGKKSKAADNKGELVVL